MKTDQVHAEKSIMVANGLGDLATLEASDGLT